MTANTLRNACRAAFSATAYVLSFLFVAVVLISPATSAETCSVQNAIDGSRASVAKAFPGQGVKLAYLRFSDPTDVLTITVHFRATGYHIPKKTAHHVFTMVSANPETAVHAVFDEIECFIGSIYIPTKVMLEKLRAALPEGNMSFIEAKNSREL